MTHTLQTLTEHTGTEIRGLDLSVPADAGLREALNAALARYHVLVFRDQKLSAEQFAAVGEIFGELHPQHHPKLRASPNVEVYNLINEEIEPGKFMITGETFHTDHSNRRNPPKATALHAVTLPSRGGDTQYVNVHAAYDALPAAMKAKLEGLAAVHVFQSKYSPRALRSLTEEGRQIAGEPAVHPLVRTHPDNGRKFLYLSPIRIESIVGMPDDEALALIAELMAHATQQRFEYRHKWQHGDMVIWDNRSVMHQANGDYDMRERRHMYRLMVKGPATVSA